MIIDTSPVLAVNDTVLITAMCEGTVLVVKAGKTTKKPLLNAVRELRKVDSHLIGVVFNGIKFKKGGKYSSDYQAYTSSYYTEYGQQ